VKDAFDAISTPAGGSATVSGRGILIDWLIDWLTDLFSTTSSLDRTHCWQRLLDQCLQLPPIYLKHHQKSYRKVYSASRCLPNVLSLSSYSSNHIDDMLPKTSWNSSLSSSR
jgi:hypothetical protein